MAMDGLQSCKLAPKKDQLCLTSKQCEKRKSLLVQGRRAEMQFLKHSTSHITVYIGFRSTSTYGRAAYIYKPEISRKFIKPTSFNIFFFEQLHSSRRGSSVKIAYIQSVAIIFAQFQVPKLFYAHNSPLLLYCILIAYEDNIVKLANPNLGSNSQNGHESVLSYLVSQQGKITYTKRDLDHQHMERI